MTFKGHLRSSTVCSDNILIDRKHARKAANAIIS